MENELQAKTAAGAQLVALAERHADEFATRAEQHDREGSYPFENIEALKKSGYLTAAIPRECSGLGVESVHDVVVAESRLARGDASLNIGVNMHFVVTLLLARHWRMARAADRKERADRLASTMARYVDENAVIAALISEAGQDLTHPRTTAKRDGDGWLINGTKVFATMSPAATILNTAVTYRDDEGGEHYGYAQVPAGVPGVTVNDDWNALGMRASGSNSVSFENAWIPVEALRDRLPIGEVSDPFLERNLNTGPLHCSASLGIAEAAEQQAVESIRSRSKASPKRPVAERPYVQMLAAENEVDLAAMRGLFGRASDLIDRYYDEHPAAPGARAEIRAVFKESQAAKAFLQDAAIRIVDRSLSMSGGAGYMNNNRLSRLYRDARAIPFMHPLGANVAYEFIGQVTLGVEPTLG